MGRPKGKISTRDDVSVKLDRAVANKAKAVATHRGLTAAEVLTEAARPSVDKQYAAVLRELEGSK